MGSSLQNKQLALIDLLIRIVFQILLRGQQVSAGDPRVQSQAI